MKNNKKLLLLQVREGETAQNEYDSILLFGDISADMIEVVHIKTHELHSLDMLDYSAVIVGGGPLDVSTLLSQKSPHQLSVEHTLKKYIQQIYENDIPFLGLCYGLGILVDTLGGTVSRDYGEAVGPVELSLTTSGQKDELFAGCDGTDALVGHHEGVATLPVGAVLLAHSPDCPVQAMRIKNNIYGTQFHPELDAYGLAVRLDAYRHHGYFSPEEYDDIVNMAKNADLSRSHLVLHRFCKKYC